MQLDLPPRAYERLVKFKLDTDASTYAEVIKKVATHGRGMELREADFLVVSAALRR